MEDCRFRLVLLWLLVGDAPTCVLRVVRRVLPTSLRKPNSTPAQRIVPQSPVRVRIVVVSPVSFSSSSAAFVDDRRLSCCASFVVCRCLSFFSAAAVVSRRRCRFVGLVLVLVHTHANTVRHTNTLSFWSRLPLWQVLLVGASLCSSDKVVGLWRINARRRKPKPGRTKTAKRRRCSDGLVLVLVLSFGRAGGCRTQRQTDNDKRQKQANRVASLGVVGWCVAARREQRDHAQ